MDTKMKVRGHEDVPQKHDGIQNQNSKQSLQISEDKFFINSLRDLDFFSRWSSMFTAFLCNIFKQHLRLTV